MSERVATLDPVTVPLTGRHLIEASAGTGKTYTITTLFVRLVVEERLSAEQILVVTFTRAATAELRDRIRRRLQQALLAVEAMAAHGHVEGDKELARLVSRWDLVDARVRLTDALGEFDLTPVSTIHGFCQRALRENAFESAVPFDLELVEDPMPFVRQVAMDLWTNLTWQADRTFVSWLERQVTLDDVVSLVVEATRASPLRVLPDGQIPPLADEGEVLRRAYDDARKAWARGRSEVLAAVDGCAALDGKSYRSAYTFKKAEVLDAAFAMGVVPFGLKGFDEALSYFDLEVMAGKRKASDPDGRLPSHPALDALTALRAAWAVAIPAFEDERVRLCRHVMEHARQGMQQAKEPHDAMQFFDDLIADLADALTRRPGKERLAQTLRAQFQAALIDEFQDTDPVQWQVFGSIYPPHDTSRLFLIGDPKQAIYAFRGADLYAYLQAREGVPADHRWSLDTNWRSDAPLVGAVNALFSQGPDPFGERRIPFSHVNAHHQESRLRGPSGAVRPLRFRMIHERGGRGAWGSWADQHLVPGAVADDIVSLLQQGLRLHDPADPDADDEDWRDLRPADVAVLVSTHKQAAEVQAALDGRGVPSVRYGNVKVFDAPEALELEVLMDAVARPNDVRRVRAALVTPVIGCDAHDLARMETHESLLQGRLLDFRRWRDLWDARGFMRMFQQILHESDTFRRELPTEGGERRLTNLRHLAELVHAAEQDGGLTPLASIAWLRAQRAGRGVVTGPTEVRLESDDHAVQVVTMHASKGLEYPVVFCPYLWRPASVWGHPRFHDPDADERLTLQLHKERYPEHEDAALAEARSEALRLAYVALTRARHLCVVTWGRLGGPSWNHTTSPLAHLLHPGDGPPGSQAEDLKRLGEAAMVHAIEAFSRDEARDQVEVSWVEPAPPERFSGRPATPVTIPPRTLSRRFDADLRMSSFTGLVRAAHDADAHDVDADRTPVVAPEAPEDDRELVLAPFPRGARAGTCYHAVMEDLDFTDVRSDEAAALVGRTLARFGFDAEALTPVLLRSVADVVATPLGGDAPRLDQIGRPDRVDELAFVASAGSTEAPLRPRALAQVFAQHGPPHLAEAVAGRLERLGFAALDGALKGFVDLIYRHEGRWWLVDYKTNHLGPRLDDYDARGVDAAMVHGDYVLQYHLYVLALHRWLSWRLPGWSYERDFGGVRYLFVRGMTPTSGASRGVFADRPSLGMILALDAVLGRAGEAA